MPNDTSTLNGSLQELGETMAVNLVTKGVTNASASDGLTTLAGKILNIQSGTTREYLTSIAPFSYNSSYINVTQSNDYWYFVASQTATGINRAVQIPNIPSVDFDINTIVTLSFTVPVLPTTTGQFGMSLLNASGTTMYNPMYYRKSTYKWGTNTGDVAQQIAVGDVVSFRVTGTSFDILVNNTVVATRTVTSTLVNTGSFKICFYSAGTSYSSYIKDVRYTIEEN